MAEREGDNASWLKLQLRLCHPATSAPAVSLASGPANIILPERREGPSVSVREAEPGCRTMRRVSCEPCRVESGS